MAKAIYDDLVFYDFEAADASELIRKLGAEFERKGFVKDTYVDAVAARELEYPTGLQLDGFAVAMPHTSGVHVNTPAIGVARLKHPVTFGHMGDPEHLVEAELIFMMAILDPDDQIEWLRSVMKVFTNKEMMSELCFANNREELLEAVKKNIGVETVDA
ncbi:MAG: PTS sugar transporter subunit IIA [Clostridiales Family XIII bacterium]|jgi:PTS system galactitol-specific IIA component|nr:PTS sugar transporter subunit IIA [Clostridiales Family XIII bacterium]